MAKRAFKYLFLLTFLLSFTTHASVTLSGSKGVSSRNTQFFVDSEAGFAGRTVGHLTPDSFTSQITRALSAKNAGTVLEGQVAKALNDKGLLMGFQNKLWREGTDIGEIDIETSRFIIEVASGAKPGKTSQLLKLQKNVLLNPERKPVLFFAPKVVKPQQIKAYNDLGVTVVNSLDDLFALGDRNGGL